MKHKQIIYSRIEYKKGDKTTEQVFKEYEAMFEPVYDERGVQISGASAAINVPEQTVIVLTYSEEADNFLRLKFYGRKDVKYSSYRQKVKE